MLKFDAIGTSWQIDIYDEATNSKQESVLSLILERISIFDKHYSRFRDDSMVMNMSKAIGQYKLPDDASTMMTFYLKLYTLTGGLFTPLIGQTLVDAGYDAKYTLDTKTDGPVTKPVTWPLALDYNTEKNMLNIKQPVLLDFGGIGKGYLIDIIGKVLKENGIEHFCIDAGGDILHFGNEPLHIGLEHPENIKQVIGTIYIQNQSICGSAGNRRAWKNFHHIINPNTGEASRNILASWVIAPDTIKADALATCLFFVPASVLIQGGFIFEYLIVNPDYSIQKSEGFGAELFTA